jgi:hypothetical protein
MESFSGIPPLWGDVTTNPFRGGEWWSELYKRIIKQPLFNL